MTVVKQMLTQLTMSTLFSYLCLLISIFFHNSCVQLEKKIFLTFEHAGVLKQS